MIKKLLINKLGRFENFTFDNVDEFKRVNVLYGWNYSGKTTLSRAFMYFDTKTVPEHYDNGYDFKVEIADGTSLSSNNPTDSQQLQTKVFNSDYVEKNLFFKDIGASNILVLADNAQEIMDNISKLTSEINQEYKNISEYKKQKKEYQDYIDKRRTEEARLIKKNLHITTFTSNSFQSYERKLNDSENVNNSIIEDDSEVTRLRTIAIAEKNKNNIENIPLIESIDLTNIKDILSEVVSITTPLERLVNNKDAEKWVREGLLLHQDESICLYCGQPLNTRIIQELNAHFDKTYNDFISRIEALQKSIQTVPEIKGLPDTSSFYQQFENSYIRSKEALESIRKEYNKAINNVKKLLSLKLTSVTQPVTFNINYDFSTLNMQINTINNDIIKTHNDFNADFDKTKEEALEVLQKHYVASVIYGPDYVRALEVVQESEINIAKTKQVIKEKEEQKKNLEKLISESSAGADKVNIILNRLFMGKSEIELAPKAGTTDKDNQYVLKRNNAPAHNLSEGEKTAIAFAHFIASLDAKDLVDKYGEIILYIDDPISSLDNNHIYSVFAEIERLKNELYPGSSNTENKRYKQIFVSTHNYHLFSLLTEKNDGKYGIYYIQRNKETSIITNFPKYIINQKAEYSFLYVRIKKYIEFQEEDHYVIGHFLRRFVEIFATYKNPTKKDLRNRLDEIVALKPEYNEQEALILAVYKTINDESHTYITNEIINNGSLKNTAEAVLNFVRMVDEDHYNFLERNDID